MARRPEQTTVCRHAQPVAPVVFLIETTGRSYGQSTPAVKENGRGQTKTGRRNRETEGRHLRSSRRYQAKGRLFPGDRNGKTAAGRLPAGGTELSRTGYGNPPGDH